MCKACWEKAGKPYVYNQKVRVAVEMIEEVYSLPGGEAGGGLHNVLDDWNVEDTHIAWCRDNSIERERATLEMKVAEYRLVALMMTMSMEERYTALAIYHGLATPVPSHHTGESHLTMTTVLIDREGGLSEDNENIPAEVLVRAFKKRYGEHSVTETPGFFLATFPVEEGEMEWHTHGEEKEVAV